MKKHKTKRLTYAIFLIENLMPYFGLKLKSFYDNTDFEWLKILEENASIIKKEYVEKTNPEEAPSVLDLDKNLIELTNDDGWKAILLSNHNGLIKDNAEKYPETIRIINQLPNVVSAAFSILKPYKNLSLHRGPYRGLLFVHLGIVIPNPNTEIIFIVNKQNRNWKEGEAFGFEDSFLHEVINKSDKYRTILLLEVIRTDIPFLLLPLHRWIIRQLKQ